MRRMFLVQFSFSEVHLFLDPLAAIMAAVKAALYFQCPSSKLWGEDGNKSQESSLLLLFVLKLSEFVQTIIPFQGFSFHVSIERVHFLFL